MKIHTILVFLMSLNIFISPNVLAEVAGENALAISNSLITPVANGDFNQQGYYTFRQDFRECVSPICGGIFVKAVNKKLTRCADGRFRAECYIASINNKNNIDIGSAALLHGAIRPKIYQSFGNLGIFVLKSAYRPATAAAGKGQFVGLEDNAIRCISTPCFSVDQYLLNRNKLRVISGIDLEQVGASEKNLSDATDIMANGGVLLAAGVNKQVEEVTGAGITFVANQFYLPNKPVQ